MCVYLLANKTPCEKKKEKKREKSNRLIESNGGDVLDGRGYRRESGELVDWKEELQKSNLSLRYLHIGRVVGSFVGR